MPIATAQHLAQLMVCWPVFSFIEVRDDALVAQVVTSKQSKSSRTVAQPGTETDGQLQGTCLFF